MSSLVLIVLGVAAAAVVLLVIVGVLAVIASRGERRDAELGESLEGAVLGEAPSEVGGLGRV